MESGQIDTGFGYQRCQSGNEIHGRGNNAQASRKRWIKEKIYSRLPIGVRPALYFLLRFVVQRGFLDHPSVWIFHFLQAFWYRLLVDVNVWEFKKNVGAAGRQAQLDFLKTEWRV